MDIGRRITQMVKESNKNVLMQIPFSLDTIYDKKNKMSTWKYLKPLTTKDFIYTENIVNKEDIVSFVCVLEGLHKNANSPFVYNYCTNEIGEVDACNSQAICPVIQFRSH